MSTILPLDDLGYILVEDVWERDGRRTYRNDASETREWLQHLRYLLKPSGWNLDNSRLRTLQNSRGDIIEIEPGGADTTGHFLHHIKAEMAQ